MTVHAAFPPISQQGAGAVAAAARIVPLSATRSAIFFNSAPPVLRSGARISAALDGRAVEGPVATIRLGLENGAERHVLLAPLPADELGRRALTLSANGETLARLDPRALQSPFVDPMALLAGLDGPGSLRLLKFLLTTGASLFGKGEIGAFGTLADQLVERLGVKVPLAGRCRIGRRASILSWEIPVALDLPQLHGMSLLAAGRTRRITEFEVVEDFVGSRRLLHLIVFRPVPDDAELVAFGKTLLRLGMSSDVAPRPLASWLAKRCDAVRTRTIDIVDRLAAEEPDVAILRDELLCPSSSEPGVTPVHLSRSPGGLLYMIGVDDPRGLLAGIRLETREARIDLPCDRLDWHARYGPVVIGFADGIARCATEATISAIYRSGRLGAPARASVGTSDALLPDAFRGLPASVAAAPLSRALPSLMAARPAWRHRVTAFGPAGSAPAIGLVLAAGSAPEHLHAFVASVIAEVGHRSVEIVVHYPDGPATGMVLPSAETLSAVHRVGLRVVSVVPQAMPSEGLRAALRAVRAPRCIAVGAGILPTRPGWLAGWRRRMGGAAPRAVAAEVSTPGDGNADGYVIGLNSAAAALLASSKPRLPGGLADLRATPGLAIAERGGDGFSAFDPAPADELARAVEGCLLSRELESRDV